MLKSLEIAVMGIANVRHTGRLPMADQINISFSISRDGTEVATSIDTVNGKHVYCECLTDNFSGVIVTR